MGFVRESTLTFVDLAGSEKARLTGAEGLRLKEGGHINKSLLALTTVISKLAEGSDRFAPFFFFLLLETSWSYRVHIPYRDSKLTRILQNSLGGNSNTVIICAATPAMDFAEETLSTLKFASRAKAVKTKPRINEYISDQEVLKRIRDELESVKKEKHQLEEENRRLLRELLDHSDLGPVPHDKKVRNYCVLLHTSKCMMKY